MLSHVLEHLSRVLLYRYAPSRAQLGLKTISRSLPKAILSEIDAISNLMTPENHAQAASQLRKLVSKEASWITEHVPEHRTMMPLLNAMIEESR